MNGIRFVVSTRHPSKGEYGRHGLDTDLTESLNDMWRAGIWSRRDRSVNITSNGSNQAFAEIIIFCVISTPSGNT